MFLCITFLATSLHLLTYFLLECLHSCCLSGSRSHPGSLPSRYSLPIPHCCFSHSVVSDSFATQWTAVCQACRGILQARILDWGAISFSKRSSRPRDGTHVSWHILTLFMQYPVLLFMYMFTPVSLLKIISISTHTRSEQRAKIKHFLVDGFHTEIHS